MRQITVNLFSFDELSEEAKEVARDWWKEQDNMNPAWLQEHSKSAREAIKFIETYRYPHGIEELKSAAGKMKGECPWTGYCADATAIDAIITACDLYSDISEIKNHVKEVMDDAWAQEVEESMEDEHVDENIRANNYEFLGNGEIH